LSKLTEIIAQRIHSRGIITFAEFMELALYCPEHGFYEKKKDSIGARGHFYTSVSVGNLLGQLLAFKFENWLRELKAQSQATLSLVELGSHDGQLASDIINWFLENCPGRLETLGYLIIEPSTARQKWQREKLKEFGGTVRWAAELPAGIQGVIFSNELLDSLPVRRLEWSAQAREWFEWGVACRDNAFVWQKMRVSEKGESIVRNFPKELEAVLPDNFAWEASAEALGLWRNAARSLAHGYLVTLDYGFREIDLFARGQAGGTLRVYHQHSVSANVLDRPGEQDITYSVNFDEICWAGEQEGLSTLELASQSRFLTSIFREAVESNEWQPAAKDVRNLQTLVHPDVMGGAFHVLVQARRSDS
jgi:SAM-dependent MidA family methyltransferase